MAELTFEVTESDTAVALGSGEVPVLGTPRMVAWCEAVTLRESPGESSVGTRVALEHLAASPVGARVRVEARLSHRDGRLLRFEVHATDAETDRVLAHGEITRVVVDKERFLSRVTR